MPFTGAKGLVNFHEVIAGFIVGSLDFLATVKVNIVLPAVPVIQDVIDMIKQSL